MTSRHQTWVADSFIGLAILLALCFVLLEFSKARLP